MDLSKIREKFNCGEYTHKYQFSTPLPVDHVIDENLTVKRNRELVAEHNNRITEARADHQAKQAALNRKLTADVIEYIMDNYDLNHAQAAIVERHVYQEHHSFMCDYFTYIDSVADLAEDIIRAK